MDLLETHNKTNMLQVDSKQGHDMLSLDGNETFEMQGESSEHPIPSDLVLDSPQDCHEREKISSPPTEPPQQLLQDTCQPLPGSNCISSLSIPSQTNETEALPENFIDSACSFGTIGSSGVTFKDHIEN